MAVFESYGYVVGEMAPSETREKGVIISRQLVDDENSEMIVMDEPDEYARATLPVHFGAGLFAGSIHGLGSTFFEWHPSNLPKFGIINTFHHSVAHSLLFGTYEGTKRIIIHQVHSFDDETNYYGAAYLTVFGLAGGIAGQIQYVASHYTEQWLGLSDSTLRLSMRSAAAPTLRPVLLAFLSSAIGFLAFEYGKNFTT
uniref:Uncharacterized protein n=1 Tax=Ditylum brightwellii TaxID=49249 RepID=A0A7S2EED0_9STRA|mmetsp:Transcript_26924/g.40008  ORF Transcript_26924/g.40008 Transcript_26924/m.40008 type:complete len:198 (+) Transcript_26924:497-1090(+)